MGSKSVGRRCLTSLLCGLLMGLSGCADNAILELDVTLPANPNPDTPLYAQVLARSSRLQTFEDDWLLFDSFDGFQLEEESQLRVISIVADPVDYDSNVLLRVLFCTEPRCTGIGDDNAGERRMVIERPFYSGQRTRADWTVGDVTDSVVEVPEVISVCQVRGCRSGDLTSYCYDGTEDHFCSR